MRTASWASVAVTVVLSSVVAIWLMVRGGPDLATQPAALQAARVVEPIPGPMPPPPAPAC